MQYYEEADDEKPVFPGGQLCMHTICLAVECGVLDNRARSHIDMCCKSPLVAQQLYVACKTRPTVQIVACIAT